jgi:hypothetical protein
MEWGCITKKVTARLISIASVILAVLTMTPLAAADVAYKITVATGTLNDAGTDANVFITLGSGPVPTDVNDCRAFPEQPLEARGLADFERGQTDVFRISDRDLADVPWICLRRERPDRPGWFVNTVTIQREDTSQVWQFLVFRWLALNKQPGSNIWVVVPHEGPLNRSVDSVLLPYQASNYSFKTDTDSTFRDGNAAFGSGGSCPLQSTVQSPWPINSDLLISRRVSIPHEAFNVRIMASVDNDILEALFNNELLASNVIHDGCPVLDEFRFDPQFVRPGSNLLSFHVRDRGDESFFDTSIRAEVPILPSLPKTSNCFGYTGFGAPACPWDLVPLIPDDPATWFDDNNFLLNPQWKWQQLSAGGGVVGGAGVPNIYTPINNSDISTIASSQKTGGDDSFLCNPGHMNLQEVTYTGKLKWESHAPEDDDYNIRITGPTVSDMTGTINFVAGGTINNMDFIKGEFNAEETISHFDPSVRQSWWFTFRSAVDGSIGLLPTDLINGHDGVMTGLMGFDVFDPNLIKKIFTGEHPMESEIHPVHALAIRMKCLEEDCKERETLNPADDGWAFFVRNWGNEGYCSSNQHYIHRAEIAGGVQGGELTVPIDTRMSIRIQHPEGMAIAGFAPSTAIRRSLRCPRFPGHSCTAPNGFDLKMAPNGDAIVTFLLNVPTEWSFKYGELHLAWAPRTGTAPVARATTAPKGVQTVTQGARVMFNSRSSAADQEEAYPPAAVYNALSPEQQELVKARIQTALPPEDVELADDVELDMGTVFPESAEASPGQAVFTAPDQRTEQIVRVRLAALCAVTGGITPQAPELCQESNIVTPFVALITFHSTFKTTEETAGCPAGFLGQFSFTARLANERDSPPLSDLRVRIATLGRGNLLQNADGRAGGEGSTLTVPQEGAFSDGILSSAESVDVPFVICLRKKAPFRFLVDILGVAHENGDEGDGDRLTNQPAGKPRPIKIGP